MRLSLPLPEPLLVELETHSTSSGRSVQTWCIYPATRDQVRRALALDFENMDNEGNLLKLEETRGKQAVILASNHGLVTCEEPLTVDKAQRIDFGSLTAEQCAELSRAMLHHHLGQDPVQAAAIHRVKKNAALLGRILQAQEAAKQSTQSGSENLMREPSPLPHTSESLPAQPLS